MINSSKTLIIAFMVLVSTQLQAREYGEIMTIHSGDADASGKAVYDCHVKIKNEADNQLSIWLPVVNNNSYFQPSGCALLMLAYASNKRVGYSLTDGAFIDICLADKIDC